jgi:hypothetical protein
MFFSLRKDPMNAFSKRMVGLVVVSLLGLTPACFPSKKMTVISTGLLLEEVARSAARQTDLQLIQEGMPSYLLLMDGMIEAWPDQDQLLLAAARMYSSYASLIEERSEEQARVLYGRARGYALNAMALRGLRKPAESSLEEFHEGVKRLGKKDLPYLFWAASCWANWIGVNLGSMEALADLPRVEAMMRRVLELDEAYSYGGAHIFMGIWYASRPKGFGGDLPKAQGHFLKAIQLGQGKFLMTYVYFANYYARKAMDRPLFTSTLQKVLEAPADAPPELNLLNTVARKKAEGLLARVEEYFE